MLKLIVGTAGSGKSTWILNEITKLAREGRRALLIVPEQFSFMSEHTLTKLLSNEERQNVEVSTFTRLCGGIFKDLGGLAGDYLSDVGKHILMSVAIDELKDTLKLFGQKSYNPAFVSNLVQMVTEFKNASVSPEEMAAIRFPDKALNEKIAELSSIYSVYNSLVGRQYLDNSDDLARASALIEGKDYFGGVNVFADGFVSFTGGEMKMLEHILRSAENTAFAFCADEISDHEDGLGLFSPAKETMARLRRMAEENGVSVASPLKLTEAHRFRSDSLRFLEGHFLRDGSLPHGGGDDGGIMFHKAVGIYDEAEFIAGQIKKLTLEDGFRYRDIAVIARDLGGYSQALETVFQRYGIPYFEDARRDIACTPLMALCAAALEAAAGNFDSESVIRLMKTSLTGHSIGEISRFENYCYVWSLSGRKLTEPFILNPSGIGEFADEDIAALEALERTRASVMEPLITLRDNLRGCDGVGFAKALFDYLTGIGIFENLERYAAKLGPESELTAAELSQLWDTLLAILDEFAASLSGKRYPLKRFYELFQTAVSAADLGRIPQTLDQVIAGTADMIRLANPRAVFIIGFNDGIFPAPCKESGFLNDADRKSLKDAGVELGRSSLESVLYERLFMYNALSSASERLFVSCSARKVGGTALAPSWAFGLVRQLFPGIPVLSGGGETVQDKIFNEVTALDLLCRNYDSGGSLTAALKSWLAPRFRDQFERIEAVRAQENYSLSDSETLRALVGRDIRLSPTRVEKFFSCRFSDFCKSSMNLLPRRKAEISQLESGTLIHYVLQRVLSAHAMDELKAMGEEALNSLIQETAAAYLEDMMGDGFDRDDARMRYVLSAIVTTLSGLFLHLFEEFDVSLFEPVAFELPIGRNCDVKPIELITASGARVRVEGIIDRVDVYSDGDEKFIRVIDYKSGGKRFRLSDVLYGLNMQMLLYLFAVCQNGGDKLGGLPAGILYLPVKETLVDADRHTPEEDIRAARDEKRRANGLLLDDMGSLNAMEKDIKGVFIPAKVKADGTLDRFSSVASLEQFGKLTRHVQAKLDEMAGLLMKGDIKARPVRSKDFDACRWCDYTEICAFAGSPDFVRMRSLSNRDVLEALDTNGK